MNNREVPLQSIQSETVSKCVPPTTEKLSGYSISFLDSATNEKQHEETIQTILVKRYHKPIYVLKKKKIVA